MQFYAALLVSIDEILLIASVLLLLAITASKASSRLGVPGLLLFIVIGMLAGSDGPGGIPFDNAWQAQSLGVVSLAFILFAGGLETEREKIRPIIWQGLSLSTIGVLITTFLVAGFARMLLKISWPESLLLGAIVSSTDAAAVFSVLRSQNIGLKGHIKPLLELESGSNDPMAVFLTTGLIQLMVHSEYSVARLIPMFILQMGIGAVAGILIGRVTIALINRLKLQSEGLYPVLTTAVVLLAYGATALLNGNGFLAVYLAGIEIGNGDFIHKRSLIRFHDGLSWLMQIAMFLVLGLLVFPSHLVPVAGVGTLLAVFLILVARPASVFLSLLFSRMQTREKVLVSWVGLRGAVPIVLATFPLLAGLPDAALYFDLVFFIVLASVLFQGTTIGFVARKLGLEAPVTTSRLDLLEFLPTQKSQSDLVEMSVAPGSAVSGKQIVALGLPRSALIVLISRDERFITPHGATTLAAGDKLLVLVDKNDVGTVRFSIESERSQGIAAE